MLILFILFRGWPRYTKLSPVLWNLADLLGYRFRSVADPQHFGTDPHPRIRTSLLTDPAPVPAVFISDLQAKNKFFVLLLFEATFTSFFKDKKRFRLHSLKFFLTKSCFLLLEAARFPRKLASHFLFLFLLFLPLFSILCWIRIHMRNRKAFMFRLQSFKIFLTKSCVLLLEAARFLKKFACHFWFFLLSRLLYFILCWIRIHIRNRNAFRCRFR